MSPFNSFVDIHSDFLQKDSVPYQTIMSELLSINFHKPAPKKTATTWLTTTGKQYKWFSAKGHATVKDPVDMTAFPGIHQLMKDINSRFGCKLNSCLASYYETGTNCTRYHSDDESSLDPSQGLYVVSLGASRTVDILPAAGDKRFNSEFSVEAADCSLYIMKPGCQEHFVHRVRSNKSVRDSRFSLSFRCMIMPVKEGSDNSTQSESDVTMTTETTTTTTTTATKTRTNISSSASATPIYYRTFPRRPKVRKTTVLFGTSITKYVRANQLGFRGRKVVNMSQSGAKIKDIKENVRTFYEINEAAKNDDIEKVIFSFGTNDIKFSKFGVRHLRGYISDLIDSTKSLFPAAIVLIQCCLPIRCMYSYIARNVIDFNLMLKEMCFSHNCIYIDCFRNFLTKDLNFCNEGLYHDWLHLNNRGLGVLSTWLKFVVNENSFGRVVDNLLGL